jgi:hypothetical protein
MNWRRRLRDIAVAGGLAGCTTQVMSGGTSSTTTGGSGGGGATGSTSSATGVGGEPGPACNASPDPCCPCASSDGNGGYGGAACINGAPMDIGDAGYAEYSCASALACDQTPTKACCDFWKGYGYQGPISLAMKCSGIEDAGTP